MFFFPALFFLLIALILKGKPAKICAGLLAIITLVTDIYQDWWAADLYTVSFALLVFLLSPFFIERWHNLLNKTATNPQLKPTPAQIKTFRITMFIIVCSFIFPLIGFYSLAYPDYTNLLIMGCGVLAFILGTTYMLIANQDNKPKSTLGTDKSVGMTILGLFATWPLAFVTIEISSNNFVVPAILIILFGLLFLYLMRGNARYLAAGATVILADFSWRLGTYLFLSPMFNFTLIAIHIVFGLLLLACLLWMIKKPSWLIFSILSLVLTIRYATVIYQVYAHLAAHLTPLQLIQVSVFQTCWMLLAPVLLLLIGLRSIRAK